MRKLIGMLAVAAICLQGCKAKNELSAVETKYKGYYEAVEDVAKVQDGSLYYDMRFEMTQLQDGSYRYYIFIDQPQCGMFDIVAMAVENGVSYENATKMAPSVGIFEDHVYNMIPNQVYTDKGYVEGIVLSGESDSPEIDVKTLVEWHDKTRENDYREFGSYHLTLDGATYNGEKKEIVQIVEEKVEEETVEEESIDEVETDDEEEVVE